MAKLDIFYELERAGICYAVIANSAFLNNPSNQMTTDWFILGSVCDRARLKRMKFRLCKIRRNSLMEYDLTEQEYIKFKSIQDKFIKIIHNKDGKVFELKNKSFKDYYDANMVSRLAL